MGINHNTLQEGDNSMNELLEQVKEERRNGRLISLPIDYEKEYKQAYEKLHYHTAQYQYHATMYKYYQEQVEELLPFTDVEEKRLAKIAEDKRRRETTPEYIEMKKNIKRRKNNLLVERMLRETGLEV